MNSRLSFVGQNPPADLRTAIGELRRQEYAKASGFTLDLSTLAWNCTDDQSHVLVAHQGGKLISTMRGEVLHELSHLEQKLECKWSFPIRLELPVLLLSRAATSSLHRSSGLNLALRYWFLRFAEHQRLSWVVGTFVSGSPRERSLREMGYQLFENKEGWQQSSYRSHRSVSVAVLDLKKDGAAAMEYCLSRAGDTIREYKLK